MVKIFNIYNLNPTKKKKRKDQAENTFEDQNDQILQNIKLQIQKAITPI